MNTTALTGPQSGYVAHAQPQRETEKRETRPVEPPAESSAQRASADAVEKERRPEQEFVFPPAPGLLSLIMRAESAKQAEREVRDALNAADHPAAGVHDPPVNAAGQSTSQHAPGEVIDKYV